MKQRKSGFLLFFIAVSASLLFIDSQIVLAGKNTAPAVNRTPPLNLNSVQPKLRGGQGTQLRKQPLPMRQEGRGMPIRAAANNIKKVRRKKANKDEVISLDFDNVDIRVVLKFMSELTDKNFLIDEKVRGKVTILSPRKISPKDAYKVLESILEVHGFAAVPSGKIVKIVPITEGKTRAIETKIGKSRNDIYPDDRIVTQLIPLDWADAIEIKNVLAPLISKNSNIIAYPPTNTIILTDISSNVGRLAGIIKELDVESVEFEISVIQLNYALSDDIANMILSVIDTSVSSMGRAGKRKRIPSARTAGGKKTFKVVSDSRTNSLIVVATPQDTKRVRSLVSRLDIDVPKPESKIHVYYLENAVAEDLVKVLSGQAAQIVRERSKYKGKGRGKISAVGRAGRQNITIAADKATNSLVITASKEDYLSLKEVIKKLDIPRSQVLVEAVIMEVSMSKSKEIGTELRTMDDPAGGGIRAFGGTSMPPGPINSLLGAIAQGTFPSDSGLIFGMAKGDSSGIPNIGILIRALQTESDVNILSTPHIVTMDNQEAEIIIGEERPFLTRTQTDATGNAITNSFDFKDVGITLRLTPHITRGKYVRLELFQEIKNFVSENPDAVGAVTTTKRQTKTTVVVGNQETIVIGGLISDDKSQGVTMVPCLGKIPLLGWLFKSFTKDNRKTNLMIFITPKIINNPEDFKEVTMDKKMEIDMNIKEFRDRETGEDIKEDTDIITK